MHFAVVETTIRCQNSSCVAVNPFKNLNYYFSPQNGHQERGWEREQPPDEPAGLGHGEHLRGDARKGAEGAQEEEVPPRRIAAQE